MLRIVCLLVIVSVAYGLEGFDAIQSISTSTFTCLKNDKKTFFIARIWHSNGKLDTTGIANIKNARAAGLTDVGGYVFPCASSSCPTAKAQIQSVVTGLKNAGATVNYIWVDVETYGTLWWDHTTNRQFILDMVNEIKALGYKPGVYASATMWSSIVGADYTGLSSYPLWWATYNSVDGMGGFKPFGGWTSALIHQYHGTETGPCSVSMDLDFKN